MKQKIQKIISISLVALLLLTGCTTKQNRNVIRTDMEIPTKEFIQVTEKESTEPFVQDVSLESTKQLGQILIPKRTENLEQRITLGPTKVLEQILTLERTQELAQIVTSETIEELEVNQELTKAIVTKDDNIISSDVYVWFTIDSIHLSRYFSTL